MGILGVLVWGVLFSVFCVLVVAMLVSVGKGVSKGIEDAKKTKKIRKHTQPFNTQKKVADMTKKEMSELLKRSGLK